MPQYQKPFANLGAAVGGTAGAAGGGLLGAPGQLLEMLDLPRQAAWNVPASIVKAWNSGDYHDLAGALPGLAGGLGMAFGGPLAGAIAAGATQGFGHMQDERRGTHQFEAPTGEDLYRGLGGDTEGVGGSTIPFLLQALGDPLNAVGGSLGGMAGAKYGKHLENVAAWRGPQYGDEGMRAVADAIGVGMKTATHPQHRDTIAALARSPLLEQMAQEVPPGSRYLGTGFETMALETPTGGVVSLRRYRPDMAGGANGIPAPRPVSPDVVPAVRSKAFAPESGPGFRVEHSPFSPDVMADTPGGLPGETPALFDQRVNAETALRSALEQRLESHGENAFDLHFGNVGWGPEGKMLMRDPGASMPAKGQMGLPRPEMLQPAEGNPVDSILLRLLGAKDAVRREIATGTPKYPSPYDAFTDAFSTPTGSQILGLNQGNPAEAAWNQFLSAAKPPPAPAPPIAGGTGELARHLQNQVGIQRALHAGQDLTQSARLGDHQFKQLLARLPNHEQFQLNDLINDRILSGP